MNLSTWRTQTNLAVHRLIDAVRKGSTLDTISATLALNSKLDEVEAEVEARINELLLNQKEMS